MLLTLAGLLMAPAQAQQQQHGVTILRGESSDQLREAKPDMGVRRTPSAAPSNPSAAPSVAPALPIARDGSGNGVVPPAVASEMSQALSSPKTLSASEAAALGAAFKAVDESRFADARAAVANFNNPLLVRIVEWSVLRVAPRKDADFASTWRFLRESPDWPEPEVLRRQAEDRIGPATPPQEVVRYFTAFPPLTSAGQMRRLEAASAASPADVPKFASDSWRNATFRKADEEEFLSKYGQHLSGDDQIARFDRILREGRAPTARELMPKLPPDYQPLAEARLAMATRAADATTVLRGVPAAKLAEPTIKLEQLAWLRRTGNFNDAKAIALQATANQTDAWWNERQQLARDLLAAGHAADAYAVTVPHGQTKGIAFAEAEFLAGWIALRHLKKPAEAQKHFQTLYDGAPTDFSKSRAAYWLGRTHEAANRPKEATDWFGRAAAFGQTFYGQLAARKLPGGSRQLPSDPVTSDADRQALAGRELVLGRARADAAAAGDGARGRRQDVRALRAGQADQRPAIQRGARQPVSRPDAGALRRLLRDRARCLQRRAQPGCGLARHDGRSARRQDRHGRLDRDDPVPRDPQLRAEHHGRRRRLSRPPERVVPLAGAGDGPVLGEGVAH